MPPRLAGNTIIESTFEVSRRFRCTMRVDCGQLDPGAVIRADPGEWRPRMRAGRDAIYQLAAMTIGASGGFGAKSASAAWRALVTGARSLP